ncbi:hypothetical protein tb265_49930 [Gemmatimonadetes bacterium T265]|nr:hypothetical protein tb265_49930 [Gemmatimonadetes bacterium T265]
MTDLAARVRAALRAAGTPLWFPHLTQPLVDHTDARLQRDLGLTPGTYSTARVRGADADAPRDLVARLAPPKRESDEVAAVGVELLPAETERAYDDPGFRFLRPDEIRTAGALARAMDGLALLDAVPSVGSTVRRLVRSLHLLDTGDDDTDVSFSEPELPFSVFVSVPTSARPDAAIRVAEGILHEAMHLQLTLIESVVPLVNSDEGRYFSPWRNEQRPAQGILHALYVFRVIDAFLEQVAATRPGLPAGGDSVGGRRALIAAQVREVESFRDSRDLTAEGAALAARLLDASSAGAQPVRDARLRNPSPSR